MNDDPTAHPASLRLGPPQPLARARLFCLPWAGAGASAYWPLSRHLTRGVEVIGYQPPGRESRFGPPAAQTMDALVADFLTATAALRDRPYLLLGHSLGAMLATEIAASLFARGEPLPELLVASGCAGPGCPPRHADIGHLPDTAFLDACTDFGGFDQAVLGETGLLRLILPGLRADCRIAEGWRRAALAIAPPTLPCPFAAIAGDADRFVLPEELQAWSSVAAGGFTARVCAGGHFYLRDNPASLVEMLDTAIAAL